MLKNKVKLPSIMGTISFRENIDALVNKFLENDDVEGQVYDTMPGRFSIFYPFKIPYVNVGETVEATTKVPERDCLT